MILCHFIGRVYAEYLRNTTIARGDPCLTLCETATPWPDWLDVFRAPGLRLLHRVVRSVVTRGLMRRGGVSPAARWACVFGRHVYPLSVPFSEL